MASVKGRRIGVLAVVLAAFLVAALVSPAAQAKMTLKDKAGDKDIKLQLYGFSQFEMRGGDGWAYKQQAKDRPNDWEEMDGPQFQAQRIRVGFNYFHHEKIAGKLFLDFNQSFTSKEAGLAKAIKDAFVAYRWNDSAFIRMGMIKTPLGMSFTVPGWNLDNIERSGLDKGLVLERDFGLMLSGRLIGQANFEGKKQMKTNGLEMGTERQGYGFGYDIGVFNPAGRSSAVTWDDDILGDALAYVGRIHFDYGPALHIEVASAVSEQAGGVGTLDDPATPNVDEREETEDYEVMDIGIASELELGGFWWEFKGEYIDGSNIKGVEDRDQNTLVATVGWLFHPNVQAVVKHYMAEHEMLDGAGDVVETELQNTYIGFNFYPSKVSDKHRDLQRHKIVVNYVMTGGDDLSIDPSEQMWQGVGGYLDDTWGIQWQYKY